MRRLLLHNEFWKSKLCVRATWEFSFFTNPISRSKVFRPTVWTTTCAWNRAGVTLQRDGATKFNTSSVLMHCATAQSPCKCSYNSPSTGSSATVCQTLGQIGPILGTTGSMLGNSGSLSDNVDPVSSTTWAATLPYNPVWKLQHNGQSITAMCTAH